MRSAEGTRTVFPNGDSLEKGLYYDTFPVADDRVTNSRVIT